MGFNVCAAGGVALGVRSMRLKLPAIPDRARLAQAFAVARDLLGAAALGATLAIAVFGTWLAAQFGRAPTTEQLADSGTSLLWVLAGVYAALWLVRAVHPAPSKKGQASSRRSLSVAPLVRASGNSVLTIVLCHGISLADLFGIAPTWLTVFGYPMVTLIWLVAFAAATRGRAL